MTALVRSAWLGAHAEIAPSSEAKMNCAGLPGETSNALVPLYTWPVGRLWPPAPPAAGMVMTSESTLPLPSYSVTLPEPLLVTHCSVPGPFDRPQPLMRFGSALVAGTLVVLLETKFS